MERLRKAMDDEKKSIEEHKEKILSQIRRNKEKSEHEKKIDQKMMLIQKTFEEWFRVNGPSKKKRKGRKKGK